MKVTKREFLKRMSLLTAGGVISGSIAPVMASKSTGKTFAANKQIGLQIYSLGNELTEDVPAGMKKIKDIGYSYIELAGYGSRKMGEYDLKDYRKIVEDAGLKITSSHVSYPTREAYTKEMLPKIADFWKQTIEDHVTLGCETLVQPMMPAIQTHDDAKLACEAFNSNGKIAKAAGIRWGYHNHNMEFQRIVSKEDQSNAPANPFMQRGDVIYDLLINGTDPDLVLFEMDVYWCVMGGNDPLEYFAKYPDRFPILHIKDRSVLGQSGMMNFANIFTKAYENGLERYYVELERIRDQSMSQFEGVKQSFDYLNNSSFVK